jgi:hypothetical protein
MSSDHIRSSLAPRATAIGTATDATTDAAKRR